jgi:gamma-glutamylcyclotransferase (GGCT)/AIG2-like uncharacterized protein YtfP
MPKLAVYGTLRKGQYNFNRFDLTYLKTETIQGWDLYDLGPYPCAVPGEGILTVEIMECDEYNYQIIKGMELGAGYKEAEVQIDKDLCFLYYYPTIPTRGTLISSGDYLNKNV